MTDRLTPENTATGRIIDVEPLALRDRMEVRHDVVVEIRQDGAEIHVAGYGQELIEGPFPIVNLVVQDGELRLVYFPEYDSEESVTVLLEGAKIPKEEPTNE